MPTTLKRVGASSVNESPEQSDVMLDWTEHFQARQHVARCGTRVQGRCLRGQLERSSDVFCWVAATAALGQLIEEARQMFAAEHEGCTVIYFVDECGGWTRVGSKPSRPASSTILGKLGEAEALLADCRRFLSSDRWYGTENGA